MYFYFIYFLLMLSAFVKLDFLFFIYMYVCVLPWIYQVDGYLYWISQVNTS
jgi:hypothetical protein